MTILCYKGSAAEKYAKDNGFETDDINKIAIVCPTATLTIIKDYEVVGKRVFRSFGELYASLPLGALGYGDEESSSASPDDMLKYYTEEEQIKNGVVGIEIRLL